MGATFRIKRIKANITDEHFKGLCWFHESPQKTGAATSLMTHHNSATLSKGRNREQGRSWSPDNSFQENSRLHEAAPAYNKKEETGQEVDCGH